LATGLRAAVVFFTAGFAILLVVVVFAADFLAAGFLAAAFLAGAFFALARVAVLAN
jgi:hypothetical protein